MTEKDSLRHLFQGSILFDIILDSIYPVYYTLYIVCIIYYIFIVFIIIFFPFIIPLF